jgi:hypothetical protein
MRFACWTTKATDKRSENVILIAFPRQKWCCERAYVLRYTYIACVVDIGLSYYVCTYSEIKIPFSILLLGLMQNILNIFLYILNLFNITYIVC